jgi:hypothetical protein
VSVNHRYRSESIEVVMGTDGAPAGVRWRGRRYVVRAVMATWVESVPWWPRESRGIRASGQRDAWRVEATAATGAVGVYELYRIRSCADEENSFWGLLRVLD